MAEQVRKMIEQVPKMNEQVYSEGEQPPLTVEQILIREIQHCSLVDQLAKMDYRYITLNPDNYCNTIFFTTLSPSDTISIK